MVVLLIVLSAHAFGPLAGPFCRTSFRRQVKSTRNFPHSGRYSNKDGFDLAAESFDLLSLRSFRRDAILQYETTNQSEPLRIALSFLGILFALSFPSLAGELGFEKDMLVTNFGPFFGFLSCGSLFLRNRASRTARLDKLNREYSLGDLEAIFRGVRRNSLRELRGSWRVVVLVGDTGAINASLIEARVYRRRLAAANVAVVPVFTDGGNVVASGTAFPPWLWVASDPGKWISYFDNLLEARGLSSGIGGSGGGAAWLALNFRGRSVGSALGTPRWDELLGTCLTPLMGDGSGNLPDQSTDAEAAAAEAAEAATAFSPTKSRLDRAAIAEALAVLDAQARFYAALTGCDELAMQSLWAAAEADPSVDQALAAGGGLDPWASQLAPGKAPVGMRATDCDALVVGEQEAWSTAVERPAQGGTLLSTQRWRKAASGAWLLSSHRTIPWSAIGGTAVATLRCDSRGCVALARAIDTPAL